MSTRRASFRVCVAIFVSLFAASIFAFPTGNIYPVSGLITLGVIGSTSFGKHNAAPVGPQLEASITTLGVPITENFNSLASSTPPLSSVVPTGWAFVETGDDADGLYLANSGGSNSGNTYSYGANLAPERGLGQLRTGTLVTTIGSAFSNNSGTTISSVDISYIGEQWRLGAVGRVDRMDFQYSLDATSLTTGTWIDVDSLDFTAPITTGTVGSRDGNNAANRTAISDTISGLEIPNGATFWIRWNDLDATGNDDGLAIDDFSLTANGAGPPGSFAFNPPSYSPDESAGTATITVRRNGGTSGTVEVNYAAVAGTPAATGGASCLFGSGVDYVTPSGTLTFADGDDTESFSVTICNDDLFEGTEQFIMQLSNPTNGSTIGTGSANVNILDSDTQPSLQFTASNFDVNENGGTATVTVSRTGAAEHQLTVNYSAVTGGTATPGTCGPFTGADFVATNGMLTFVSGDISESFPITICNDGLFEANNETILIALNTQSAPALLGTPNEGTVTIIPNDDPPTVQFTPANANAAEGTTPYVATVTRTGAIENSFSVQFDTIIGTAVAGGCGSGGDFTLTTGLLNFTGGDPSLPINISICDDTDVEGDEFLSLSLSNPTNGAVIGANNPHTVTIVDNDFAPTTLVVDSLTDDGGLNGCTAAANDCSLRGANSIANDGDTITFASSLFLPEAPQTITLVGSEIAITDELTITGPGADQLTIDGGPNPNRIFYIDGATLTVTISGVSITGGNGTGAANNGIGGAIYASCQLTLDGVHIFQNTTNSGGGVALINGGPYVIRNSTINNNAVVVNGGGIDKEGTADLTVINSTISGNTAGPPPSGFGGGMSLFGDGNVIARNSTFTENFAGNGGGIANLGGNLSLGSTIVAGNSALVPSNGPEINSPLPFLIISAGFNLIGDTPGDSANTGAPIAYSPTDVLDINPQLGLLANNGGPTPTHRPAIFFPGHDKGCTFGSTTDQRRKPRTADWPIGNGSCDATDIGAFEILIPTAADASISGRVLTASGRGIANVLVTVTDMDGNRVSASTTNTFGFFTVRDLPTGRAYIVTLISRRFRFDPSSQVIMLGDDMTGLNFQAGPLAQ